MTSPKKRSLKKPTIADVAKAAGVGTMTVSRAINGHPYVSEAVLKKVQSAIRKLGYAPSQAAQMLNGRPSSTIGLIVPDLADPFFAVLTQAVQEAAREQRFQVWIAATNSDVAIEQLEVQQMLHRGVDGILLIASKEGEPYLSRAATVGKPLVAIDRPLEAIQADSIEVENYRGAQEAVNHLIQHGRKRILCVGYNSEQSTVQQRVLGYKAAMEAAKLPILLEMNALRPIETLFEKVFSKAEVPDAIFSVNNVSTLRTLEALKYKGLRIPHQVALVGFDDIEPWRVTDPPITAVRQPVTEMGGLAVRILLDRIQNQSKSATRTILPTRLIIRASCGCHLSS